jgi:hypothetical protein
LLHLLPSLAEFILQVLQLGLKTLDLALDGVDPVTRHPLRISGRRHERHTDCQQPANAEPG